MEPILLVFLLFSVVIHELAHGYAALSLGDPTAKLAGRLTLNPIPHIDPVGSVIIPAICLITGGFFFGWAKPVPYNPHNLGGGKWAEAWVAASGALANIALAVMFALLIRLSVFPELASLFLSVIVMNVALAIFNLMPVPGLDGSKVILPLLSFRAQQVFRRAEGYFLIGALLFIFILWPFIVPIIPKLVSLLVGA